MTTGDTLKTIADQNYARNSQRLEYDDEQRSLLHNFDDSVSSGNRAENEEEEESDWTNDRDEEFGDEPRSRSSSLAAKEKKHCSDRTLTSDRGSSKADQNISQKIENQIFALLKWAV